MNLHKLPLNVSFWESNRSLKAIDIAVVGAGICGLSTAFFLKKLDPSRSVHLFEKGPYPSGATIKNAGFSCVGSVTEIMADLSYQDEQTVIEKVKARKKGLDLLRQSLGDEYIEYNACGGYELFENHTEYDAAVDSMTYLNAMLSHLNDGEAIFSRVEIAGKRAIKNGIEGAINSGKMVEQLLNLVQNAGVILHFNSTVNLLKGQSIVDGYELEAKKIIYCTNAYTSEVNFGLSDLIKPGRGYIMLSKPIPELHWKGTFHMHQGYVYFRNIGDRFLIGGFRNLDKMAEETLNVAINEQIKNRLLQLTHQFLGLESTFEIEQEWVGFMGFTSSGLPIRHKLNEQTWIVGGFNGMGIALGMEYGRQTALALLD